MKKFRVVSDIHLDVNHEYPIEFGDKSVFTVFAGDTSGDPAISIPWIRKNAESGLVVCGNHMPYNERRKTMAELRREFAAAFPASGPVTYLDAGVGVCSKIVDGILFVGSCCYTNMAIADKLWNPDGDIKLNCECSAANMNDYRFGVIRYEKTEAGAEKPVRMWPEDYRKWFIDTIYEFDRIIDANEMSASPLPVVVITHHPLIRDFLDHNWYVEKSNQIDRQREFNYASYASDYGEWLMSHPSVRCHVCGHIHAVEPEWRDIELRRSDGSKILVVNNARGYLCECHDNGFNPDTFVDVESWTVERSPLPASAEEDFEKRRRLALAGFSLFF